MRKLQAVCFPLRIFSYKRDNYSSGYRFPVFEAHGYFGFFPFQNIVNGEFYIVESTLLASTRKTTIKMISTSQAFSIRRGNKTGKDRDRKYDYKINFATAVCICMAFRKRSDGEINPCRLIGKFLIPIRLSRPAPGNLKTQSQRVFLYRAA